MGNLEKKLKKLNPHLLGEFNKTKKIVSKLLQTYVKNFPTYTDHSIEHTQEVLNIAGNLLTNEEIEALDADEIYVLSMACILHDIGMCIPEDKIKEISETQELLDYRKLNPDFSTEKYIRDIHHILSLKFINEEWKTLKIPSEKYAEAIGLVAQGHRKVDLNDFELYDPQFFLKSGREFICLPFLSCILRIADELDVTNLRTPELLLKYYIPNNKISEREWNKHKSTIQVNFRNNKVIIQAKCSDHNILAALEEQFEKITSVLNDCQKVIRSLQLVDNKSYCLTINSLEPKYIYDNFDPKGIKYTFEVNNVIKTFIGKELYKNDNAALREAIQNAIDSCNYKKTIKGGNYSPKVIVYVNDDFISIEDNGQGMDEFIIENYFGKLASSFYQQESIKSDFQAIGQFGVGVFSYFLICDYIDIETKRSDKKGLKFRTDRDPNGYFHFFDNFHRDEEGTKLILHLKDKHKGKFSLNIVTNFINKLFPFVDIPIIIKDESEEFLAKKSEMEIDFKEEVLPHFYYNSRKYSSSFEIVSVYEKNEKQEAVLGILVPKNYKKVKKSLYQLIDLSTLEDRQGYINNASRISFYQKGVFINNYEGRLNFSFGKININQKLKINLNRTDFVDENSTQKSLEIIEAKLIQKVFSGIKKETGSMNLKHKEKTDWFIKNYWQGFYYSQTVADVVKEEFCFEIHRSNSTGYYSLSDIANLFKEVMILKDKDEVINYASLIDCPYVLLDEENITNYSYNEFFIKYLKFGSRLTKIEDKYFKSFEKDSFNYLAKVNAFFDNHDFYINLSMMDNPHICVNYFKNRFISDDEQVLYSQREGCKINANHKLIHTIIEFSESYKANSLELRLLKELFGIINSYLMSFKKNKNKTVKTLLKSSNSIITKLNDEGRLKLDLLEEKDIKYFD